MNVSNEYFLSPLMLSFNELKLIKINIETIIMEDFLMHLKLKRHDKLEIKE